MERFATASRLGITARPMTDADYAFSEALYASTRAREVAQTGWPAELQRGFLAQQHAAQHEHYRVHYAAADRWIIEADGAAIGRLYLFAGERETRIVDVALMPEWRGHGIGSALLADVIAEAHAAGRLVSIHVEKHNPARRLYLSLGFTVTDVDRGVYELLELPPPDQKNTAS